MCRIVDFGALHRCRRAVEIGSAIHMVLAKPNGKSFQRLLRCALRRNGWPSSELRRSLRIQLTTVKITQTDGHTLETSRATKKVLAGQSIQFQSPINQKE
jgi:hypothetical protein